MIYFWRKKVKIEGDQSGSASQKKKMIGEINLKNVRTYSLPLRTVDANCNLLAYLKYVFFLKLHV